MQTKLLYLFTRTPLHVGDGSSVGAIKLDNTGNFRVALPELATIENPTVLREVFDAVFPALERQNLKRRNPYWQALESRPDGKTILQRLEITLS